MKSNAAEVLFVRTLICNNIRNPFAIHKSNSKIFHRVEMSIKDFSIVLIAISAEIRLIHIKLSYTIAVKMY